MKKNSFLLTVLMIVILPYILFTIYEKGNEQPQNLDVEIPEMTEPEQMIRVLDNGKVVPMELDSYVTGVVLGEMPADFDLEALKAQAVATRTYTLRNVLRKSKHPEADVCTDSTCCQAFIHADDYAGGEENLQKVRQAVAETSSQVITYQGNLIEATYFSCSGGTTEDAMAVWGTDVPYLQSVSSPGEEGAKHYISQYTFSYSEFRTKLGLSSACQLSNESIAVTYTEGNSVETMKIGEEVFSGTQIRTLLSLPSASFTVNVTDTGVFIQTKGNGHRVGMSQYGAEAMAVSGKSYEEILTHYYTGTTLATFSAEQMHAIFDKEQKL